jgi:hypothetical protein
MSRRNSPIEAKVPATTASGRRCRIISTVANLVISDDTVTVQMSGAEKAEALHRDLTVPRTSITGVRVISSGLDAVHGFKLLGAGIPGVMMVGTFKGGEGSTFAVCHGNGPGLVIDLMGEHFDRIVLTIENPEQAATQLS